MPVIQMTKKPVKMAKVFIALVSIAALAVIIAGGIFVYHRQVVEEKSGQWEAEVPLANDDTIPVYFSTPFVHYAVSAPLFSSIPPG
jgi:hypothetical protein